MSSPPDPLDLGGGVAPRRPARAALPPSGAGTPAGPAPHPGAGPAGHRTSPPAPHSSPAPSAGGDPPGHAGRDTWKAALSAHNAAKRHGRFTRAAKKTGPGMIRRPPPPTQGEA